MRSRQIHNFVSPHAGTGCGFVVEHHLLLDVTFFGRALRSFRRFGGSPFGAHVDLRSLVIPVRGAVDLLEFRHCAWELAEGLLETDFQRIDVHSFQLRRPLDPAVTANTGEGLGDQRGGTAVFDVVRDQLAPQRRRTSVPNIVARAWRRRPTLAARSTRTRATGRSPSDRSSRSGNRFSRR